MLVNMQGKKNKEEEKYTSIQRKRGNHIDFSVKSYLISISKKSVAHFFDKLFWNNKKKKNHEFKIL